MKEERLAKLSAPAAQEFIQELERETPKRKSIHCLIGDGATIAKQIRSITDSATVEQLRCAVSPYLQLVNGEERDTFTGLRLIDIWRYFRYLWAIPYLATPGRNLFYLVRDAAQSYHPVIGIAASATALFN